MLREYVLDFLVAIASHHQEAQHCLDQVRRAVEQILHITKKPSTAWSKLDQARPAPRSSVFELAGPPNTLEQWSLNWSAKGPGWCSGVLYDARLMHFSVAGPRATRTTCRLRNKKKRAEMGQTDDLQREIQSR